MDFESRFDCCKACNAISFQYQNNRSPIQIQGQGDCKCNTREESKEGNKASWMSPEKGKKVRSKFAREMNELESNAERQKNFFDGHCYCLAKQDFPDKLKREPKQEKKDFGSCNYFWDSPTDTWTSRETFFVPEQPKRSEYSNTNSKALTENILEFEEKVDFLFRIFKDYGQKSSIDGYVEQSKLAEGIFKDVGQFFDFNKRLCAAEEGIEKLALILEDLVKDYSKKKVDDSYNDPVDFDDMSVSQRINYLKSRNDLMLSFMKAFLKAGSAEESYSKLCPAPNELKSLNSKFEHEEKHHSKDLDKMRMMDTLQKLRMRMTELRQAKSYNEQHKLRNERKEETPLKYGRNKLEVISEQAELALSDGSETAADDFQGKNVALILNEKLSEVNEESDESDLSVQDVTFRILSPESDFLNPSLDKLSFSKMDSSDKKFMNGSNIHISLKEENNQEKAATNYDSSSELNCVFCDGENSEKPRDRNKTPVCGMYPKPKEPIKREKNSSEKPLREVAKTSGKKSEECMESSVLSGRKILQGDNYSVFPNRGSRIGCSVTDLCSPSLEERKREVRRKEQRQRPMTDPSSHRKTLPPSGFKPVGVRQGKETQCGKPRLRGNAGRLNYFKTRIRPSNASPPTFYSSLM